MVKLWTRASDMAGAPSVFGGSVLVGRAETEVGRGIRVIADQVLRLHVREQTGLMPQTHRKHLRWPGDGQSPKCRRWQATTASMAGPMTSWLATEPAH